MIRKMFNRKPSAKPRQRAPLVPMADPAYNPFKYMSEDETRSALLSAVLKDDLHAARGIAQYHTGCVDWMIVVKGSKIGNQPIQAPLVLHAAGSGSLKVLQWMIDNKVDLEARSNLLNQTALYHAAETGQAGAVDLLLRAGADPLTRAEVPNPLAVIDAAERAGHGDIADMLRVAQGQPLAHQPASMALRHDTVMTAPRLPFKKPQSR